MGSKEEGLYSQIKHRPMEKLLTRIELTVKIVFDNLIDLVWSPVWCIYNIINQSISVWQQKEEPEEEPEEENGAPVVTQYPSVNEGRYSDECDYPIGHKRIGFKQYES